MRNGGLGVLPDPSCERFTTVSSSLAHPDYGE
jgi:hypothetical protein